MFRHIIIALMICALTAVTAAAAEREQARKSSEVKLPPLTILSIIPAQAEPGATVTLNGTGFTPETSAFLGSHQVQASETGGKIITLDIPDLAPGAYALYLKREDGATSRPFNFMIQPQRPVAASLSPDTVSSCTTGREREVVITGEHFDGGARVVFDGAAIATRIISSNAVAFLAPQVAGGLHQVQVKNPSDAVSGTLALFIDPKPEILSVSVGADYVSYYELIVNGRNFQQNSTLVVDGNRVRTGLQVAGEREQIIYLGCNQILYQRHPYDPTPKEIRLQVINPSGDESGVFSISAP